uniref:Uncharacterized protein n=1 Tax=Lygus hesperus TaxID=30085 RepID=A0A0A9WRW8_LYGHE
MKEEVTTVEYSQTIDAQSKEIASLKQKLSESVKKYEEQLSIMRQDLKNAQKETIVLRRDLSKKETTITNNANSSNKEVVEVKLKERDEIRDSALENEKGKLNGRIGNQTERTDDVSNKCLSISKRPPPSVPASQFYQLGMCSPRHWPLSSASLLSGSVRSTTSEPLRSVVSDSQLTSSPKKVMNPLEVFRLPSRSCKRSPVRRKRKLYSRSDDTL